VRWGGIWHDGKVYRTGTLVTVKSSLWLAIRDSDARPGEGDMGLIRFGGQVDCVV
jgi:hypothetical protein